MSVPVSENLARLVERYEIDEDLVLSLDIGIASTGSAVVRRMENDGLVEFAGSRCFEAPEEAKTKELKNKTRRGKRLLRRVVHRRRGRMAKVREIFVEHELLSSVNPEVFHNRKGAPGPVTSRAEGLDRRLTDEELAAALLHIAKHRGFKSNSKSDSSQNAPDDSKQMLKAIIENKELSARYRTLGDMLSKDPKFAIRKRNRAGEYTHTLARDDLRHEVAQIFKAQRRLSNPLATPELEHAYAAIAFHQLPLQDSAWMVDDCPFEPGVKRSPRHAPSFEKFRLLAKLNTVKVRLADGSRRRLTREELQAAIADFGAQKSLTWDRLAKKLGLPGGVSFEGVDEKKAKQDMAASKGGMRGAATFRKALGTAGWNALRGNAETLDAITAVIAFREDMGNIEAGLKKLGLEPLILDALMTGVRDGAFADFSGAGHVSAKAARAILPHLLEGKVYSEACAAAGYDHTVSRKVDIADIRNPVVQRSLREAVKQVETLLHEFEARPGRIVVELARDVGKSVKERDEMTRGIEKRTAEKQRRRQELKELLKLSGDPSEEDLLRYELWREQNYRCVYTDELIDPQDVLATGNTVQVDHVLPRSRSQDNSYHNKVLCFAKANQDKKQRTPWEWKVRDGNDRAWWDAFEARVRALKIKGFKKRNLLMQNFDERRQGFVERNLNDTKYAARALLAALKELYPGEPDPSGEGYLAKKRRLFARPGAVTALLRRAWGLDGFKDRADDRHHALDALICAAASQEWLLEKLTRQYQQQERENRKEWVPKVPAPWRGFRGDAIEAIEGVFVSRSEKRRGRGQGHKDTIYQVAYEDGRKVTYERKAVAGITNADLKRIKDPKSNGLIIKTLEDWIARGKPADDPPKSPKGDPIRKVRLKRKGASGFDLGGGHVDNADMVRVDVFAKDGKFYLVPIYRHQVMDQKNWPKPPNRAIVASKPEGDWTQIDESFEFRFSLYSDAYVDVVKQDGEIIEGYYRSTDRSTGAITLSSQNRREPLIRGIGARTLKSFRKFQIDRLGRKHEIEREMRTWHGAVCT